jgi:hypothetical protein
LCGFADLVISDMVNVNSDTVIAVGGRRFGQCDTVCSGTNSSDTSKCMQGTTNARSPREPRAVVTTDMKIAENADDIVMSDSSLV